MYTRVESRELRRCVVRIDTVDQLLCGTGFFVAPGWVLTCAHVVKDQAAVSVVTDAGISAHPVQGTVVARSAPKGAGALWPFPDLALIRLDAALDHPCVLLEADDPLGEQECQTWGYPPREYGLDPPGSPATFRFEGVEGDGYLRLKAGQARPGLSGAPLLCPERRAVVGVVSASRNIDTDLGGWASPVSALFDGGPGVPADLLAAGRRIRGLNRAAVLADRTAWHRVLPVADCATALERPWAPFTRGPRSSPADLLRSDFAVVPYLFRDAELDALTAWCRAPHAMSVVQVAGRGGAGKTRFGLELAARMERQLGERAVETRQRSSRSGAAATPPVRGDRLRRSRRHARVPGPAGSPAPRRDGHRAGPCSAADAHRYRSVGRHPGEAGGGRARTVADDPVRGRRQRHGRWAPHRRAAPDAVPTGRSRVLPCLARTRRPGRHATGSGRRALRAAVGSSVRGAGPRPSPGYRTGGGVRRGAGQRGTSRGPDPSP
ncbi:trypsin-like peptidase domain-containing protein [Streptomyces sp. So13.3]|nr:trypsin-like peptidase domain-containing protein [Streptomyces sp. So13.3]